MGVRRDLVLAATGYTPRRMQNVTRADFACNGSVIEAIYDLGRVLFTEFAHYQPLDDFHAADVPTLIVHGDHDTAVSYDVAAQAARSRSHITLHTIAGSDHGFDSRAREDQAISTTVDWLVEQSMS
uniref:alpha/beta fold hydrolase n=1 Tax=Nocardia vinacea TaxID=96468 RepID=UPI000309A9BC|nr:alpha/beta hydrolase [Nocardia vinacea]